MWLVVDWWTGGHKNKEIEKNTWGEEVQRYKLQGVGFLLFLNLCVACVTGMHQV